MHQRAVGELSTRRQSGLMVWMRKLWMQRNAGRVIAAHDLSLQLATREADMPAFRAQWQALVEAGQGGQKVYQLPAYFDALREADDGNARVEVLAVTRGAERSLIAVVPVRLAAWDMTFRLGPVTVWRRRLLVINLLGSVPSEALPMSWLISEALAMFPGQDAVLMHAVSKRLGVWESLLGCADLHPSLVADWRHCHTMAVPATVAAYLTQFSGKKRYNLKRQIRQLGDACGPLNLTRIDSTAKLDDLFAALQTLQPAGTPPSLRRETVAALAQHGLLLCYVLRGGGKVIGTLVGTRSADVLHIHNIFVDQEQRHLSVGTTTMQLAMEDIISMACFKMIDFGYGTPKHEFSTSHQLDMRAQVAVLRSADPMRHLFTLHRVFHVVTERVIAGVKAALAAWRSGRQRA